jgi:hypothetical protein
VVNNDNQEVVTQGRLNGEQRHKLRKLLYMKYTPSELAEELGISKRQFYSVYLPLGCPHERDFRRHIWIVGTEFQEWYLETYKKRKLAKNEVYCVSCKKAVPMVNPVEHSKEGLTYALCECPECKNTVAKIITMRKR